MKAQTALAIFILFTGVFLSLGFYVYAAGTCQCETCVDGDVCSDKTDQTSCENQGVCLWTEDTSGCNPPCGSGQTCSGGTCVSTSGTPSTTDTVRGTGAPTACTSSSGCPTTAPRCLWGYCTKTNSQIEYTFDTGTVCVANYNGGQTAPVCTTELFPLPLPTNYKPECLHTVTVQIGADDIGEVCNGDCGGSSGGGGGGGSDGSGGTGPGGRGVEAKGFVNEGTDWRAKYGLTGNSASFAGLITGYATVATSSGTSNAQHDITNLVDKQNLQFRLRVTDRYPATRIGETTRSISVQFKVIVLNPSPTEKCVIDTATRKPKIVPLCAGTLTECTQTPTENASITAPRCISPSSLNGWVNGNSSNQCVDGNYRALVTQQVYRSYGCAKQVLDTALPGASSPGSYGSYNTSGFTVNGTRNNWTSRTLCPAGCSNGVCRTVTTPGPGGCTTRPGSRTPSLTSITAAPRRVAPTGTIAMTSVASDPDTVSGRREKVRLVCGTDEGTVVNGTTGGCTGTGGGTGGGTYTGPMPPNILSTVQSVRARYSNPSSDEEKGQMLNEMAWIERAGGWGLSSKPGGTNCPSPAGTIACDILYHQPTNVLVDVLVSGEDPAWQVLGQNTDTSRPWLAPVQPSGSPTGGITGLAVGNMAITGFSTGVSACDTCAEKGQTDKYQNDITNAANEYLAAHPEIAGLSSSENLDAVAQLRDGTIAILRTRDFEAKKVASPDLYAGEFFYPQVVSVWKSGDPDTTDYRVTAGGGTIAQAIAAGYCGGHSTFGGTDIIPSSCGISGQSESTDQTGSFDANLCVGNFSDSNPTCSFAVPQEWRGGGHFRNLYCRVQDESGLYSAASRTSVIVDNTPPTSQITAPAANSVQIGSFPVTVTDADDGELGRCFYSTSATASTAPSKNILLTNPYGVWRPLDIAAGNNVLLAVWNGGDNGGGAIGQFVNADGTLRGGNILLSNAEFTGGIKVAYNPQNDMFLVVWTGSGAGGALGPAKGSIIKPDGTFVKKDFKIIDSCGVGTHASSMGRIDYGSGKFAVACLRGAVTVGGVSVAYVSPDGTVSSEIIASATGAAPSIAAGTNTSLVTYADDNGAVYGRLIKYDGSFASVPLRLGTQSPVGGSAAFFNPATGEYDVFYDFFYSGGIHRRAVREDGILGPERTYRHPEGVGAADITQAGSNYWVVGENGDDYGNSIYELRADGATGEPMPVADYTQSANYVPAVAFANGVPVTLMNRDRGRIPGQLAWYSGAAWLQFGGVGIGGGKQRQCNSQFTVNVPNDCADGTCAVSAWAVDKFGNAGIPDSRGFLIRTLFTNITSPPAGSYQTDNFSVSAQDRDYSNSDIYCTYDVYSIGTSAVQTVTNAQRQCNSNFTVTIGSGLDCRDMGQNKCRVVSRVYRNSTNTSFTDERFYSIDWVSPISTILNAPASWVSSDFTISVSDDPQGSQISECQYRVVSNGTETVPWRNRTCGISSPAALAITAGNASTKNCRHEGGDACLVQVRALGRTRVPGIGDNASVPVAFGSIDTDGFNLPLGALATNRGINFSGTTRTELRAATFYACNSRSSVSSCISAYNSGNRGQDSPNFCGSLTGRCELRCSDREVNFYFAARGIPIGTSEQVTVISRISAATCPVFNIAEINRLLNLFIQLDREISIQIMQVDEFIRQNGETDTASNETLDMLNEALLITRDHLDYMNATMQDLTTTSSQQLISRSNEKLDEINRLLRSLVAPVRVRLAVSMPSTLRFNRTTVLPALITKTGSRTAYARVTCGITFPNGSVTRGASSCLALDGNASFETRFLPNLLGQYGYSCTLSRSVRPDCSFEVNQTPVTGAFRALPGFGTYISAISAPSAVLRGRSAVVTAAVNNPDDVEKFGTVRCDFTDPLGAVRRNASACTRLGSGSDTDVQVTMIADRVGNWTAGRCQVSASEFPGCAGMAVDNVSLQSANYTVATPDDVFIESILLPAAPIVNGSLAFITMSVTNPTANAAYVNATCTLVPSYGPLRISSTAGMESGTTKSFSMNVTTDATGIWNVSSCTTYKSSSPLLVEQTQTNTVENPGRFTVIARTNLSINSITVPPRVNNRTSATVTITANNPSVARYGRASCTFRSPLNIQTTNLSACVLVDGTAGIPVSIYMNKEGIWNVESCSLFGSVNPDCTSSALHDRVLQVGAINSTTTGTVDNPVCGDGQIGGTEQCDNGQNNGPCNATCSTSCTINNCGGCTPGLYHAFNTTGACAEFSNDCVPAGWINRTAGPCNANNVYISVVSVPDSGVINNSNAGIGITAVNPVSDDRFALVRCSVRDPSGNSVLLASSCSGIQAGSSRNYAMSILADEVGTWNVTLCTVNASTSCASAAQTHSFSAGRTFSVVRGLNMSFVSFALPPDSLVGSVVQMAATVRNPSDAARYARVICGFRTPSNQITSNSSSCTQVAGTALSQLAVNMHANEAGSWSVTQCSLRASLSQDCNELHNTASGIGIFNITSTQPPPAVAELFISNISAPATTVNNSQLNIAVLAVNPNAANSSYALAGCSFTEPAGAVSRKSSECLQITANSTQQFMVSQQANSVGQWTVDRCFINASSENDCTPSLLHNISQERRTVSVILPSDLYITSVAAPEEAVNNSNVPIDIYVSNPLNDDRYGQVSCIVENPNGANQTKQAACSLITRQNSRRYNTSVFANAVGTWNVRNCTVSASSSSSCSGATATSSMLNGDAFNVIRGYNLTISNMAITSPAYTSTQIFASYTMRNPSATERFGRVTCTFTKGVQIVNRSACFTLPAESFIDSRANFTTEQAGTWTATCSAERSIDSACSSVELHDSESMTFGVTNPPDLYIQSVEMPALAPKDNLTVATLRIRNPVLTGFYGFAGCTFKNRLNETLRNVSQCEEMSQDTNNVAIGVIPELRGNWSVYGCFVNASRNAGCGGNRTHNVSTASRSFTVFAPLLMIEQVYLTSANLVVGDIADITVDVKNIGEKEYTGFVNCTIFNPYNASIRLTTANQTIPLGEVRTYHPQYTVDVPGRWRVSSCSIYRLGSIILEDSENVNEQFNVTYTPSNEQCNSNVPCEPGYICDSGFCVPEPPRCSASNCPGVKDACYCSNNQCIACGSGYTCSSGRCVTETPVGVCSSNSQCPAEQICVNSVCQQRPPECYQDGDCPSGECRDGRCTQPEPMNKDIMVLLIIILAVIMVPLILFIYIKRSL